jgi:Kef-type K+ transport system membrane component KefB
MSSTAIVVKMMAERLELESEHGKRVMGILLFQDLAVVPLLVLIPALGASAENLLMSLAIATVMTITGSFDHRAIDGADGAALMSAVKALIENPLGLVA